MNKLEKNNQTLYYIIVNKNIKHTYFKPQNGYLLINKSKYMPIEKVLNHLDKNFFHYIQTTAKTNDNKLKLWGLTYNLKIIKDTSFDYQIKEDTITIKTNITDLEAVKKRILNEEMSKYLEANLNNYNKQLKIYGLKQVRIQLKYLKSKFGSYHYLTNKIIINIFLATLPSEYVDYVIYHEYAHQQQKNHQKGFYKLLEKLYKNYKYYDQELKKTTIKI